MSPLAEKSLDDFSTVFGSPGSREERESSVMLAQGPGECYLGQSRNKSVKAVAKSCLHVVFDKVTSLLPMRSLKSGEGGAVRIPLKSQRVGGRPRGPSLPWVCGL